MGIPWLGQYNGPTISAKRSYELLLGKMIQPTPSKEDDVEVEYFNSASVQWSGIEPNPGKTMWASPLEIRALEVKSGDLLICEGGDVGRAAIYRGPDGPIFQNSLHRARSYQGSDVRYLRYLLTALHGSGWLDILCNKATIAHFTVEKLGSLGIPHIAHEEQRRTADFLDAETARVDQLASLRSRQLAQLDMRERAWRSHLLEQSKSGVRMRVKHLLRVKPRYGVLVPEFVDEGVPFIRVNSISGLRSLDGLPRIPQALSAQYARTVTGLGDILLSVVGSMGKATIVTEPLIGANVARAVAVLRLNPIHIPSLLTAWIGTAEFEQQAQLATGADSAQPTLGMEDLANFSLRWPTDGFEEKEMAMTVEEHQLDMEATRITLNRQLSLLAERRQALITAAVTGGITV